MAELDNLLSRSHKIPLSWTNMSSATVSQYMLVSQSTKSRTEARRLIGQQAVQVNGAAVKGDVHINKEQFMVCGVKLVTAVPCRAASI